MPSYLIEPAAPPNDSVWQGRKIWKHVVVRAENPAQARILAQTLDRQDDEPPVGNESLSFGSGYEDEKLYWVRRIEERQEDESGQTDSPIVGAEALDPRADR